LIFHETTGRARVGRERERLGSASSSPSSSEQEPTRVTDDVKCSWKKMAGNERKKKKKTRARLETIVLPACENLN